MTALLILLISVNHIGTPFGLGITLLGRQVAELLNEEKTAGKYSFNFNAPRLASGVYIYRLDAGMFAESKKMIPLREKTPPLLLALTGKRRWFCS